MSSQVTTCGWCHKEYTVPPRGNAIFCPPCVKTLETGAASAAEHQKALDQGDVNVAPQNASERRRVHTAIRRRLTDSGSEPDCGPMKHILRDTK